VFVVGVCFFQAEDGIRDLVRSRGLGDVYKRQRMTPAASGAIMAELDPVVAYAISVVIATRNAAAPTLQPAPADPDSDTES